MSHSVRFACSLCLAASLGVAASASEVEDNGALGLWAAFLSVGDGEPGEVVRRTDVARDSLVGAATKLTVDTPSLTLMQSVREAVLELDLGDLHDMLPEASEDGRQVRMHGEPERDDSYAWTLFPELGAVNHGQLLALDASTRMHPMSQTVGKGDGYAVQQTLDIGTGPWRHGDVAALFEGALVALERVAGREPTSAQVAGAQKRQPGLTAPEDIAILASLESGWPNLMPLLSSVIRVDHIATRNDGALDVDFLAKMDSKALGAKGYGALANYIDKLGSLLVVDVSIRNGQGLPLVTFGFYTAGPGVRIGFTADDGALLPRRHGAADHSQPVHPTQSAVDLRVRMDAEIRAEGMLLKVTDYEIPIRYRSGETGADVNVPITDLPKLEFTGQGVVTSWIAALAESALNLESHGEVIFRAIAEGVDGNGTNANIRYQDGYGNGAVSASVESMVVDNALVRMGFRIVGRHLVPDDQVVAEILGLFGELVTQLERDYQAIRPKLATYDN
jgi:hypothetical protein